MRGNSRWALVLAVGSLSLALVGFTIYAFAADAVARRSASLLPGSFTATFVNRNNGRNLSRLLRAAMVCFAAALDTRFPAQLRDTMVSSALRRARPIVGEKQVGAGFAMLIALALLAMTNSRAGLS